MDLASALAAPRLCQFGDRYFWVRPFGLEDYALVVAWLDDVIPGRTDRTQSPELRSDEAKAAMDEPAGWITLAWAGLRHHGASYVDVATLATRATDEEKARYLNVVFSRRRTLKPGPDGNDIARAWFGPNLSALCEHYPGHSLADAGRLTLDQYDLLAGQGCEDEEPRRLTWSQVEAMRQEGLRRKAEKAEGEAT
jgi:hypothetical protein